MSPSASVLEAWATTRKITANFQPEDWRKPPEDSKVKLYTMHPEASSFKAPEADPECPPLYKDGERPWKEVSDLTEYDWCLWSYGCGDVGKCRCRNAKHDRSFKRLYGSQYEYC